MAARAEIGMLEQPLQRVQRQDYKMQALMSWLPMAVLLELVGLVHKITQLGEPADQAERAVKVDKVA
jgi:hypothetical protein